MVRVGGERSARRGRLPASPLYLAMDFLSALFFATIFTVSAVYRVRIAGLDPLQLVLVGTALEATAFLFEVPTGVVADSYSRRLSVILGYLLLGAGFLFEGLFPLFAAIVLAQVLLGLGYTFISGAREAWIADELGQTDLSRVYLRGAQMGQLGALLGTGVGVALASVRLNLPFLIGGGAFVALGLGLTLTMPEAGFRPAPAEDRDSKSWRRMGGTFGAGLATVRARPVLLTILGIGFFYGAASEAFDRLWALHFLENFRFPDLGRLDPVVWFGVINACALLLSAGATEVVRRRLDTGSHRAASRALFAANAALLGGMIAFGLAGDFALALGSFWVTSLLRQINEPLTAAWTNQSLESRVRATVLSMRGQADALGQIGGGPVLGAIATGLSLRAALVIAGLLLTPALALYARTVRRDGEAPAGAGRLAGEGSE